MEEGRLPHLAAIWRRSSYGYLRSTIPPITASAWSSFQTGKNPGKHGLFDFVRYSPGSYETPFVNARTLREEPLWGILSRHGKQVVVINVPVTYPPRPVNGFMISGMLTPGVNVEFTYPPGLYQELIREIEDYQIFVPARASLHMGMRGFVDRLRHVTRKRAEAALFLMRRADWDFFMVHFQSPDVLQHSLWSHLDPAHPAYQAIAGEDRQYVENYYRDLDNLVGSVVEEAGGDVTLILMSDHGFGPARKRFHANQWLAGEGFLAIGVGSLQKRALDGLEGILRQADFLKLRRRVIAPFSKREMLVRRLTQESLIDWSTTRAFALPCSVVIRLQINLRGREPQGTVEPGAEYERLRDEIAERLLQIEDPDTGGTIVEQVFKREEIFCGPALELMPDLVAQPVGGYQIATRFRNELLFSPLAEDFTGNHRMDGILMMAGPHIVPGHEIEGAQIVDLFPTILHLLDVPLPPDLDGKVLIEALEKHYVEAHPIRQHEKGPSLPAEAVGEAVYSPEDAEEIRDRLEGFGYID
jgi:predicted AlkP superfamily phosphohydrolase/phosphomutase